MPAEVKGGSWMEGSFNEDDYGCRLNGNGI